MDIVKFVDSLQTVFYEIFGVFVPAVFFCALILPFLPAAYWSDAVRVEPRGLQYVPLLILLYVVGVFLHVGYKIESSVLSGVAGRLKRSSRETSAGPDISQYSDHNIYVAARAQVAAYLGLPADALSGLETFNLCLSIVGDRAAEYRKFVSLRDMLRGISFAMTIAGIVTLLRFVHTPGMPLNVMPVLKLIGVHTSERLAVVGGGRLFYGALLVVLLIGKRALFPQEKRYESIGRRIVYPLALHAIRSASSRATMEELR